MLDCAEISTVLDQFQTCERTHDGTRVSTHCLYPSFERVHVFVVSHGDGFIVHDGGGAARAAWEHGNDRSSFSRLLTLAAAAFGCETSRDQIRISVLSQDWLWAGIASVANASADAARAAVGKVRVSRENDLIKKTKAILDAASWRPETKLNYIYAGESGKLHTFDLGAIYSEDTILIDAVIPHPNSIAAKYLAFSDTKRRRGLYKYALYDSDLSPEDKSLISGVADLISFDAIVGTDARFLLQN